VGFFILTNEHKMLKKTKLTNIATLSLAVVLCAALIGEAGLRWAGVTDFPVYETDDVIGYIPAPEQSGAFLNKNRWQINERSMGSGPWKPEGLRDLVLLGDSLVWGGNPLDQPDKLGPSLQVTLGDRWKVWSAAAGSWSVLNELAYLDRYPDVQQEADVLVWVLNTGDLAAQRSLWASDYTLPRSRPTSALAYVLGKYLLPRLGLFREPAVNASPPAELISADTARFFKDRLAQLAATKRVLVVLYPDQTELRQPTPHYQAFRQAVQEAMTGCCSLLEVREQPNWNTSMYRDGIHPTSQGNQVLSGLIAQALKKSGSNSN
jgi:hypothetical protein